MILIDNEKRDKARELYPEGPARIISNRHPEEYDLFGLEVGDDPEAVAEYVHANTFNMPGYAHPLSWTEWGELAESAPIFFIINEGPAPEGLNEAGDWWLTLLTHSAPLMPYEPGQ